MATAKRTSATRRNSGLVPGLLLRFFALLLIPGLLTRSIASASCGAEFLYPIGGGLTFYYLDTINVTYLSDFSSPTLYCWCGQGGHTYQLFKASDTKPYNGTALVLLNFSTTDPCWFNLKSDDGNCGGNSESFTIEPNQRPLGGAHTTIGLSSSAPTATPTSSAGTKSPAGTPGSDAVAPHDPQGSGENLSAGAKAGLGIGIALACVATGAMAAFLYFRRRRRLQDAGLAGAIIDHDRRHGRKGPEKGMSRTNSSSVTSGRSEEPLYPIQPVFDGFPGSTGYDDVRSMHSSSNFAHSPTWGPHSPTLSHGGFWGSERGPERSTEREELAAARLKSPPVIPTVISYGPNRVTPTLTPRPSAREDLNIRAGSISTDSREGIPPMPAIPIMPDYNSYHIPPPPPPPPAASIAAPIRDPTPSPPPRQPAVPIVVSYGPNRVTPTPAVMAPTVPPDEGIINRMTEHTPRPVSSHERQFPWEAVGPDMAGMMGPLPPYASSADFFAMEKGAIRKLEEPQAQAELPPTKDGFYHYGTDIVEYELQGAAPQHEPQYPHHLYKNHPQAGPSGSSLRDIDEQKFLLSDVEISKMREQKAKIRAAMAKESYDLGESSRLSR